MVWYGMVWYALPFHCLVCYSLEMVWYGMHWHWKWKWKWYGMNWHWQWKFIPYHTIPFPFPMPMHTIRYHCQCIPYKAMERKGIPYQCISLPLPMHTIQGNEKERHTIPMHIIAIANAYHTISIYISNACGTIPLPMHTIQWKGNAYHCHCQCIPYKETERKCITFPLLLLMHTIP
jgi:hypothetical protein